MPIASLNAYLNHLETRRIEYKIMMADVVMLPNMKKKDREALVSRWMKHLNIQEPRIAKPASPARLSMMGIGVKHV